MFIFPIPTFSERKDDALQELSDITPVDTHSRYFGATVLMKFVATSLTSKSIEEELLTNVTEGKLQERLSGLQQNTSTNNAE